ncbi:glutamate racemase [Syntrophobotulus glycolicus DSM 8271]|uniref:Glutamate racemase n=1 Tax=Syntrophobotulus glycolicus (strain DSM 8271 / FlGlyR) TaxID=645991 RepID=F0SWL7_SYNGF|nr:glutamate racemase [Syntrophobotulus glycolicus]ADY56857.1 glutamate racemase [Syntrophobotulus glycolicus DSM 8271]
MAKHHVIGVFDSGVGGLTVVKQILASIPDARIVYFGDTARAPYGSRSKEEIIAFSSQIIPFLISQGADIIVAACNTSSANALPVIKKDFDLPIIGPIESGACLAVKMTRNGKIGLLATERTVASEAFHLAVTKVLTKGVRPLAEKSGASGQSGEKPISLVKSQACPLFVPLIEAGLADSDQARNIVGMYLAPLTEAGVDTIILGCTHYPFLNSAITDLVGEKVVLVDPAVEIVSELRKAFKEIEKAEKEGSRRQNSREKEDQWKQGQVKYFVSGDPGLFVSVGNTLMDGSIRLRDVRLKDLAAE